MMRNRLLIAAVIAAAVFAAHGNSIKSGFVYDDRLIILENQYIGKFSNLKWLFSGKYFAISGEATFRPAVTFSYYLDRAFWGLNPYGYHLTNLILHFGSSLAVFYLAWFIWGSSPASLLIALIFAVHPVVSEAVNSIGYREDLISTALLLAALIFALKAHRGGLALNQGPRSARLRLTTLSYSFVAAALYFIALLSKEMAITYPIILVFVLRYIDGKKEGEASIYRRFEIQPLILAVTALYLYMRFSLFSNPIAPKIEYPEESFLVSILTMPKVVAQYIGLLFFPFSLNADYVVRPVSSPGNAAFVAPAFFLMCVVFAAFFVRKKNSCIYFGALWFFITLLPVYNLAPLYNLKAERYLYLPLFGFAAPSGILCWQFIFSSRQVKGGIASNRAAMGLISAMLVMLAFLSFNRSFVWRSDEVLWLNTVIASPQSARARAGLGLSYERKYLLDKAIAEYEAAVLMNPKFQLALNNLGSVFAEKGLRERAIANFLKALSVGEPYPGANKNLGATYGRMGSYDRSIHQLKTAIRIKPDYLEAKSYLGVVYKGKGLFEKARDEFEGVLKDGGDSQEALQGLGNTYHAMGLFNRAILEYKRGLALNSNDAAIHKNLGLTYLYAIGDKVRAKAHFAASLLADPYQKEGTELRRLIEDLK